MKNDNMNNWAGDVSVRPFPARGQSMKHPNLERNVMIAVFIAAIAVLAAIFFYAIPALEIRHAKEIQKQKIEQQERFNTEARQLRDKAIEKARKENQ